MDAFDSLPDEIKMIQLKNYIRHKSHKVFHKFPEFSTV